MSAPSTLDRGVLGLPHRGLDGADRIVDLDTGDARVDRRLDHGDGDGRRHLAQALDVGKQALGRDRRRRPARRSRGRRPGTGSRAWAMRWRRSTPRAQAREHQGVVRLADPVGLAVVGRRGRTGCRSRPARRRRSTRSGSAGVCSASGVGFDIGSTIGRGQCACIERITLLGESAGDPRRADQHRRMQVLDDLGQAERAVIGAPVGDGRRVLQRTAAGSRRARRGRSSAGPGGRAARSCRRHPLRLSPSSAHRVGDQVGDADPGRPGAEDDDLLVDQPAA